jgi:hypothetical protein
MGSLENSTAPIPTPVVLPNKHRETIDWNTNYGHTFKVVQRPLDEVNIEDSTLIVTPKNKTEWETWSEVPEENLCKLKKNWEIIQKNLSEHKYMEILQFSKYF